MNEKNIKLSNKNIDSLQLVLAEFVLKLRSIDEVKKYFDELMNQGIYIDEFIYLLEANPFIFNSVLEKTVARLDMKIPSAEESEWVTIKHCVQTIVHHPDEPLIELKKLAYFYMDFVVSGKDEKYFGIENLLSLYWEYLDFTDSSRSEFPAEYIRNDENHIKKIKKEVIVQAVKWLERNDEQL
jgi:hypothetical protein